MPFFTVRGPVVLPSAPTFTGLGDTVSGATAAWGLQAHTAAYASPGNNPSIDLNNDSTGTFVSTIKILSTGLLDVATAATVIAGGASRIGKWYDHTGNGRHQVQSNNGQRAQLQLAVFGVYPAAFFDGQLRADLYQTAGTVTIAQPYSYVTILEVRSAGGHWIIMGDMGSTSVELGFRSSGPSANIVSGTSEIAQSMTQSVMHCVQGVAPSNTGVIQVDGSANTQAGVGTTGFTGNIGLGTSQGGATWDGWIAQAALYPLDNTASLTALNSQAHTNWGF